MSSNPGEIKFNIFQNATKDNIRVGYISTERGYIQNVSVPEANRYAQQNPGTTFIFDSRDGVQYLNINEVNQLTVNDLTPSKSASKGTCNPVTGLKELGDGDGNSYIPRVNFYGGGGVGAKGNPVIGNDGSVLAVDLPNGGFGYRYPPIVKIEDDNDIGSGAVLRAVLCGADETIQVFDNETDFEEYILDDEDGSITFADFGDRYSPDAKNIGPWNPDTYINLSKNPIRREIEQYQQYLNQLTKPWWNTRKFTPLSVTSPTKQNKVKYDVSFPAWSDFTNQYAISPVPPTNIRGSDFSGIPFTFEWEEDFPFDGEYVFRGTADDDGQLYLDNDFVADLEGFGRDPRPIKKTVKSGVHRIRLDLYNKPQYEFQTSAVTEVFNTLKSIDKADRKLWRINPEAGKNADFLNRYGVLPFDPGEAKIQTDVNQDPGRSAQNPEAKFEQEGDQLYLKVTGGGRIKVNFSVNVKDDPNVAGVAAREIRIETDTNDVILSNNQNKQKVTLRGSGEFTGGKKYKIKVIGGAKNAGLPNVGRTKIGLKDGHGDDNNSLLSILSTKVIEQPKNKVQTQNSATQTNVPNASTDAFAGTHIIRWEKVEFPADGNYSIEVMVDDNAKIYIGNRDGDGRKEIGNGLRDIEKGGDEVIIDKKGFSGPGASTGKSTYTKFFKKGRYRIRVELEQIPGKPLAKGNPMAFAMHIQTAAVTQQVVSAKSWSENPMGIALTIEAPLPPIPQEPAPQQTGRCPNNPIWTTRFPGGTEKWWPVIDTVGRWSKFMDRYAISPVPPLGRDGTDSGGVVFKNQWVVDLPYDGFYGLKGTVDNAGRILIDGTPVIQANYIPTYLKNTKGGSGALGISGIANINGGKLYNWRENDPRVQKIFLTKGTHVIEVEVENGVTEILTKIDKKIFNTADWAVPTTIKKVETDVIFKISSSADYSNIFSIAELNIDESKTYKGSQINVTRLRKVEVGKVYLVELFSPESKDGVRLRARGSVLEMEEARDADWKDLVCATNKGRFFDLVNGTNKAYCKFVVEEDPTIQGGTTGGTVKNGVTYEGPRLSTYANGTLGPFITPFFVNDSEIMGKTWKMIWKNVDFPVTGEYKIEAEADDRVKIRVDGNEVGEAEVFQGVRTSKFTATAGKKTVELEVTNILGEPTSTFRTNPVVAAVRITTRVDAGSGVSKSWRDNPMGISAVLIPPPCPKIIKGQGIICDVIVDDPGNGYKAPKPTPGPEQDDRYPAALRLKTIEVEDGGINYNCGVDQIQITPSNGAVLNYVCDTFGRITGVNIIEPGLGFTTYPDIRIISDTGVNARFRPQFEVIRDPIVVDEDKLIQVVDLVGLQQTGYVNGRPYYGSVFFKDGIRYAGFYETPGTLVRVYDTLQESITGEVTTKPSAILRQGTNIQSNNPRLNIPGTPDNLI